MDFRIEWEESCTEWSAHLYEDGELIASDSFSTVDYDAVRKTFEAVDQALLRERPLHSTALVSHPSYGEYIVKRNPHVVLLEER